MEMIMNKVSCSPPWQVVVLLSHHLDPDTLALASCVSKSWRQAMSSDHLWRRICQSHYPTLSSLHRLDPSISYRRLFSMARSSYSGRSHAPPPDPRVKLHHVSFVVDVDIGSFRVLSLVRPGDALHVDPDGIFRFDIDVGDHSVTAPASEVVRVGWWVVGREWTGVFGMVGDRAKGRSMGPSGRWFSEELPACGCCMLGQASGLVAEVGLGFGEGGLGSKEMVRLETVKLGLLSVVSWRYVSVNQGLRYLQHFLLP